MGTKGLRCYEYASGVLSGEVVACKWVRLAAARFEAWLGRDDMRFDEARVARVVAFVAMLKHFKNRHRGQPFVLEAWQEFIVACVFGFYWVDSGRRVCQSVYIEMARKNGKTAFAAALSLYALIGDGVAGAEVDLAANSKEQARIAFEFASKFARGLNSPKREYLRIYRNSVLFDRMDSKMLVFASDASKLDGYGASCYILDEYHEARDTKLKDVLQSSQADRDDPLGVVITTAGFNKDSPCYKMRTVCTEMLLGLVTDDTQWAFIYTLDEGDDISDEGVWRKCSPNLWITVREAFLRSQIVKATNDPSADVGIRTKTFNIWCDSAETWIPEQYITAAVHRDRLLDYAARGAECFVGIDLSATSDLTAVAYLIEDAHGGPLRCWVEYYLPEAALQTKPLREQYREWARAGALKITPGNVVDYERILADILAYEGAGLYLWNVSYDAWNATQFVISATNEGLTMQPFAQNIANFNRPTKELERRILSGTFLFDNNPITRFCLRNVSLRKDHNGNEKPDKSNPEKKIDGIIATLEALGGLLTTEH